MIMMIILLIVNHKTLEENHIKDFNVVIIYKNND